METDSQPTALRCLLDSESKRTPRMMPHRIRMRYSPPPPRSPQDPVAHGRLRSPGWIFSHMSRWQLYAFLRRICTIGWKCISGCWRRRRRAESQHLKMQLLFKVRWFRRTVHHHRLLELYLIYRT